LKKKLDKVIFVNNLIEKIDSLTTHIFVSKKKQAKNAKELKANFPENVCILQGDFSQNNSMITQNPTQVEKYYAPLFLIHRLKLHYILS
jgi:superfamily II DNA/RNA helicase